MADKDLAQQTSVETKLLTHLMDGLKVTMVWKLHDDDGLSRKLSTLRFIGQSFQRHLEHLLTLEEHGGYMETVTETSPHQGKAVEALRQEHDGFRSTTAKILFRLERMPADVLVLNRLCEEWRGLLDKIQKHNKKEIDLLLESLEREVGGEG